MSRILVFTVTHGFDPITGDRSINNVRLGNHDITTTNDGASPIEV